MAKLKLSYPEFRHAPSVICGTGSMRSVAGLDDGMTAFLTSGNATVNEIVEGALAREGGELTPSNALRKPQGEPTHESIRYGSDFLRSGAFRRIVAVGGGSVLDWARLAWAHSVGMLDLDSGTLSRSVADVARPEFWLVPTTCATGAEAADVAVFCARSGLKAAAVSRAFVADKVVLDGSFLETVPPRELAAFLCDALSHSVESALSIVPLQLAKETAFAALRLITVTYPQPPSSGRRDRFMEAGFLGGIAAANCSVGVVHAFAHSVGADGLAHGLANACALSTGLDFNAGTPQMHTLLQRLGLDTHEQLLRSFAPIVETALEDIANEPIAARLQEGEYQRRVAARMATDVALRTNPRRASADELLEFVRAIAVRVARR